VTSDVGTVIWKELREGLVHRTSDGGGGGGIRSIGTGAVVFGIFVSWSAGQSWTGLPAVATATLLACLAVVTIVPDSFAGERDRKTLETLLTSRLSDRAIMLGKVAAASLIGTGAAAVALLVAIITVNVRSHSGGILVYSPLELIAALGAAALVSAVIANVGVLASLRAPSVMSAQKAMMFGLGGAISVVALLFTALPAGWKTSLERLAAEIGTDSPLLLVAVGAAVLLLLNWAVFAVTVSMFRRPKLIRA